MTNFSVVKSGASERKPLTPRRNSIFTSVDLDRSGKQIGYFCVPQ